jgi:hypothetical protein
VTLIARAVAAVGIALAFAGVWVRGFSSGLSYWSFDHTIGGFGIVLAGLAALALVAGFVVGRLADSVLLAIGAVMLGFYGWYPAALASGQWHETGPGTWLAFGGSALVVAGAWTVQIVTGAARTRPTGLSPEAVLAGVGIALVFAAIWLDVAGNSSYWDGGGLGHSLGIVLIVITAAAAVAWGANVAGRQTWGIDQVLTLVLLGMVAFWPVRAAFEQFGDLQVGAWLALGGGVLAASATWAAHGNDVAAARQRDGGGENG